MSRSRAEARPVATSQELLRSALHRSQRRNTWVARRRLAWRWTVYLLGKVLVYLGPPLLVASLSAWWWLSSSHPSDTPAARAAPEVAPAARPTPPASAAVIAAPPAAPESASASAPLQLRLDDESLMAQPQARHRRLPSRSTEAASAADAQE